MSSNNLNYFEITGRDSAGGSDAPDQTFDNWKEKALDIGDFKVIPKGENNDIPNQIQDAVFPNSLAPRLQNRKVDLLIEQGPFLYKHTTDGLKYYREPIKEDAVNDWLFSNNIEELLIHNATEYYYQNEVYTKIFRDKASRLGVGGSLATMQPVHGFDCRLAYKKNDSKKRPTHVIIGDWKKQDQKEMTVYPLFDPVNPTKYPVAIHHAKFGSYGMKEYALPEIYGALDWIKRSTSIPKIFQALTDNSLNIKWHIQSPAKYWADKRKILMSNCSAAIPKIEYKEQMLEDLKQEILGKLSTLLSGTKNVGKFWHNEYVVELIGGNAMEHGWKITPIEQKIKEYVAAQIEISNKADFATVAALGLHAALGNVGADGKSDSGSEQLYALKIHQLTSVNLPEFYVCKAVNDMLYIKFGKDIKIGFYHVNAEREQDVTQSKRTVNQTPSNQAL
ncbi:portal protein [Cellulophaga phage Ingeline_1]|uniref:Portal protein n=1 Tax=Cellulophaga phage Ingeline_1 TaxID=2745674 RepID=A0A8E4ZBL5_9CAUD|nr:portal protein [Cellulophaga phage Ingeline_1]QQV90038.1 portal protein [Cellulophaga phage Ingeline_2]QQV90088.1 portal protein [Cellulophaga phage Ingeline_3]QQV90138.1 portal protein [Cellulophaga phage Ingeline_4]QQV90187.1 portal protein [Cellulophaga phage Ingeline_5]QQV90237.1 portal protein [Cellulophaga phage Ingeline_6]QQV90287.1 portal protein [Cellulophaga phage Ingeline_7]QQV90295.1 portal protein [Cellulophaga phage Ingeline_8]